MKRFLLSLAIVTSVFVMSAVTTPAYAILDSWQFDLSGVSAGLGNHTNVDRLIASGIATIAQSFGADGIFNNGDTFTEASLLYSISYWTEPGYPPIGQYLPLDLMDNTSTTYQLYASATGLTGYVYNVSGSGPSDWKFDYAFNPGVGSVAMYLDADSDPTNGTFATLATFSLVNPSGGQGPAGFLGGSGPNGTTDLTMLFVNPGTTGVFKTAGGMDFYSLPVGYYALGLVNTHNSITSFTSTGTGFNATAFSNGQLNVDVVPEPTSMLLFGIGTLGLAVLRRKKVA